MKPLHACLAAFLLISFASTAWAQGTFPLKAVPVGEAPPTLTPSAVWNFEATAKPALKGLPRDLVRGAAFFCAHLPGGDVVVVEEPDGGRLWVDTNADGDLSDEKPVAGRATEEGYDMWRADFPPVTARLGGVAVALKLSIERNRKSDYCWLFVQPATVMAGTASLGGVERKVYLVDVALDGKYIPWAPSGGERQDVIAVDLNGNGTVGDEGEEDERLPLPKLLRVGDSWYSVRVAGDGAWIEFEKTEPKFGTLDVGDTGAEFDVTGESGVYRLSRDGAWRLPAGRYVIDGILVRRNGADGQEWWLTQDRDEGAWRRIPFAVEGEKTTKLKFGAPLSIVSDVKLQEGAAVVSIAVVGQAGEHYYAVPGRNADEESRLPMVKISNEAGKELASATFEYG